jgi:hypothetical protein
LRAVPGEQQIPGYRNNRHARQYPQISHFHILLKLRHLPVAGGRPSCAKCGSKAEGTIEKIPQIGRVQLILRLEVLQARV